MNATAATRQKRLLMVDFENIQQINPSEIPSDMHIVVFLGAAQKNISIDLVAQTQKLGSRLEWKRIETPGKNALDFFIAYYLGRTLKKEPQTECVILSKDTGFDPLIKALKSEKHNCRRITRLSELKTASS